jgi:hypothetical protein
MLKRDDAPGAIAAQLAQLFGLSVRAVNRLAEQGIAVRLGPGRSQLAQSVRGYCAHLRSQAGLPQVVPIGVMTEFMGDSASAVRNLVLRGVVLRHRRAISEPILERGDAWARAFASASRRLTR